MFKSELWCWRRLLRILWTARRSNQSILKEISPEYSLEYSIPMMLKLKLTDAEAETQKLWPPDVKNWLIGKDPDAGKDWRQEKKGTTEDEMVGWHHWLDGHEFEQAPGVGDGQGNLACCSLWGCKELDMTEQLNWTEHNTCWWIGYSGREKLSQWGLEVFILNNCENRVAIDSNEWDGKWSRSGGYSEVSGIIFHAGYVSNASIYTRQTALYRQLNMSIAL